MSLELLNISASTDDPAFTAADYLVGLVQRCMLSLKNTRIVLPGKGEVIVLPERGEYYTNVQNMEEFCRTPATQFETSPFSENALSYPPGSARNIKELLWQAGFYASQGRLIGSTKKYDVVQMTHWPNLTRLPVTPNTARLCALLTRYPASLMIIHRVLGIEKSEVFQVYSAACSAGLTITISHSHAVADLIADATPRNAERGLFHSLFAKISGL